MRCNNSAIMKLVSLQNNQTTQLYRSFKSYGNISTECLDNVGEHCIVSLCYLLLASLF